MGTIKKIEVGLALTNLPAHQVQFDYPIHVPKCDDSVLLKQFSVFLKELIFFALNKPLQTYTKTIQAIKIKKHFILFEI